MESTSSEREQPRPYQLGESDFRRPVYTPQNFTFGEKPTRENLASFLSWSFGISRGDKGAQQMGMEYVQNKTGFDFRESIQAWVDAGEFDAFSDEEKELITRTFRRVGEHERQEVDLISGFNDDLSALVHEEDILEKNLPGASLLSRSEFLKRLNDYIEEEKTKHPEINE